LALEHLPRFIQERHLVAGDPRPKPAKTWTLDGVLEAVEKRLIELAMRKSGQSQTEAAALLGVFRTRLGRRLEALGLTGSAKHRRADPPEAG
jgi:DNA-binding NtrC family response regulator